MSGPCSVKARKFDLKDKVAPEVLYLSAIFFPFFRKGANHLFQAAIMNIHGSPMSTSDDTSLIRGYLIVSRLLPIMMLN